MKRLSSESPDPEASFSLMWAFICGHDGGGEDVEDNEDDPPVPEYADLAYELQLGRFAMTWGAMEATLDFLIALVFRRYDISPLCRDGVAPEIPRALERRIEFLKSAFKKVSALNAQSEAFRSISAELIGTRDSRNTLIHGVLVGYRPDGGVTLFQVGYERDHHVFNMLGVDPEDLSDLVERTDHLRAKLVALASRLLADTAILPPP